MTERRKRGPSKRAALWEMEGHTIVSVVNQSGSLKEAAQTLGRSERTIYRRLRQYGMKIERRPVAVRVESQNDSVPVSG